MHVGLFIKDFELGTKVSAKLTELDSTFEFYEKSIDIPEKTKLLVIDLDHEETGNEFFIHQLSLDRVDVQIIGYMKQIVKEKHDKFRIAGCNVILPKSSLVKNLSTFIRI
ncbi:MAG: hypothetical protein IIB45_07155 [Candidatus Marinimicrobia bacterium]|nr:hypothetical protein [Candidatus Neomarinimicrobiota bacterium]